MAGELQNQVAIVTGASRGIGRAIALRLARAGAGVVLNYHHGEGEARGVADEIAALGGMSRLVQGDVGADGVAETLMGEAEALGRLTIVVSNAGITRDQLLLRMRTEDIDEVLRVDLRGPILLARAALRPMLKARYGRIIFIASIAGVVGNPGQANYAAAKAGLLGVTRSLAQEMGARGITVNAVAPGLIDTDMSEAIGVQREAILSRIPAGRIGRPEEVAAVVAFLTSADAAYVNGETIKVDGGLAPS